MVTAMVMAMVVFSDSNGMGMVTSIYFSREN